MPPISSPTRAFARTGAANAAKKLTITYEPLSAVGVISPWNGPLSVPPSRHPRRVDGGLRRDVQAARVTPLVWRMAVDGWKQVGAPDVLRRGVRVR